MALAAMDVELVDVHDCDINDFDVMEALGLDLSSVDDLDFDAVKALDLNLSSSAGDEQVGDLDCSIFDFDFIKALDLDLSSADDNKFRGGGACYSAIFSDADTVSHCRHICEDGDDFGDSGAAATCAWLLVGLGHYNDCCDGATEEEVGSSSAADSVVTDDEPLTPASGDEAAAEAMWSYVAELERFLFADDDDEQAELDQGLLGVFDNYFAGNQLLVTTVEVVSAAGHGEPTDDIEEEENGVILAAREHEQSASRKRARNKIKGTAWTELEVMNPLLMHLAQIQVPAAPWPRLWLLLCCL